MTVSRRRVLEAIGAAVVMGGVGLAFLRSRGYPAVPGGASASLDRSRFALVRAVAARVCAPDAAGAPSADEVGVASFVDAYASKMAGGQRADLLKFLDFIEQLAPAMTIRSSTRFTRLTQVDQDRVLAGLEASEVDLLRGGFAGLKALVFMGYYRDPRTWSVLGYEGPTLGRAVPPWPLRAGGVPT
jgi:hypothetical protein